MICQTAFKFLSLLLHVLSLPLIQFILPLKHRGRCQNPGVISNCSEALSHDRSRAHSSFNGCNIYLDSQFYFTIIIAYICCEMWRDLLTFGFWFKGKEDHCKTAQTIKEEAQSLFGLPKRLKLAGFAMTPSSWEPGWPSHLDMGRECTGSLYQISPIFSLRDLGVWRWKLSF